MSGREVCRVLAVSALILGCTAPLAAQTSMRLPAAEHNAWVAAISAQDPAERLQGIDGFLKQYPQSLARAHVYPNQATTAWALKHYGLAVEAADNFLAMDRAQVANFYRQNFPQDFPSTDELAIDKQYYRVFLLFTYGFLLSFKEGAQADTLATRAAERAQQGLELHRQLYSQVPAPPDEAARKQFEATKLQEGASFHKVLATVAWRKKDYAASAREYLLVVEAEPQNAQMNRQLALSYMKQEPPQWLPGLWTLARTLKLTPGDKKALREALSQNLAAYEGVEQVCVEDQVDPLVERAAASVSPPADFSLPARAQVEGVRADMTVAKLIEGLKAGGETTRLTWLAACRLPIPEIVGVVVEVQNDGTSSAPVLKLAITDESATAKTPDVELRVAGQPGAKEVKNGYELKFSGVLSAYQAEPFLLKLSEGKINPESLPKPAPAPTRRRGTRGNR